MGWIKLDREITEHWLWKEKEPFDRRSAWIDLLLMANHKDFKTLYKGQLVERKRGEVNTSTRYLAERWRWSRGRVNRFLELLVADKMVTLNSTTDGTTVTIENWGKYQCDNRETDQQNVQPATNNRPAKRPTTDHTQEIKNKENNNRGRFTPPSVEEVRSYCQERNNKINAEDFCDFYASKGWMVGKNKMKDWKACVRTWERSRKNTEPKSRSNVYVAEPPKYKPLTPDPEVDAVQMPDELRNKLRSIF